MAKKKNQGRKQKINLVFDEDKRKDFLCGFRKRKLERKKKAQEELQTMLKVEKKRIKLENKESYKKLVVSSRPIPDIEQLLQEEYEDDDVNVKIVELSSDTLQKRDLVIGENKPNTKNIVKKSEKNEKKPDMVTGMDSEGSENEDDADTEANDEKGIKTKKEIKKILKDQAKKKVQKSKVFQMKSKLERVQNKKKSNQKKDRITKAKNKLGKDKTKNKLGREKTKKKSNRKKH